MEKIQGWSEKGGDTVGNNAGHGDVLGPTSAVDGHLAVFSGVTGKVIADGGAIPTGVTFPIDLGNVFTPTSKLIMSISVGVDRFMWIADSGDTVTLGWRAGQNASGDDSYQNTYLGSHTGQQDGVGNLPNSECTFVGCFAGEKSVGVVRSTYVGNYAGNQCGYDGSKGDYQVMVGYETGINNYLGEKNTVVGATAFVCTTPYTASNNSIFGYGAGSALSSGSNNILIGYRAGDAITTGAGNILIGYDIDATGATVSNTLKIGGSLLVGTGINAPNGTLGISATVTISSLAGVGSRTVVADASGALSAP